jgi:protein SCO1
MKTRQKLLMLAAALSMPVVVFGLPVVIVLALGPERSDAVGRWVNSIAARPHAHPIGKEVPFFTLTDQQARSIARDDLRGHVWVASFFFSRCAGTCPMTSAKMAKLQSEVTNRDVRLVSFSMDSQYDTPEVLREYAKQFDADPQRWHMLTGDQAQITNVVESLGLADALQGQKAENLIHSDRFVLIDRDGRTRGFYISTDENALRHLADDAAKLAVEERSN